MRELIPSWNKSSDHASVFQTRSLSRRLSFNTRKNSPTVCITINTNIVIHWIYRAQQVTRSTSQQFRPGGSGQVTALTGQSVTPVVWPSFYPRDAMLASYYGVRLSVRPSDTSRYCIETAERIELFLGAEATLGLSTLCYKRIWVSPKITVYISVRNFVPNSGLRKISPQHIDRRKRYQLSSTDDRRLFITLSVHFCLQYHWRDADRLRQLRLEF